MRPHLIVLALTLLPAAVVTAGDYDAAKAEQQVQAILAGLGDKQLLPANQVFTGVTISPTSSAERYLRIMDTAFSRSLGVDCAYCHDPADWASDAKHKFETTRAMWTMTYKINQDQLRKIEGLDKKARVNCTTCHRGEITPAVSLD